MTTLSGGPKVQKGLQIGFMGLEHHGSPKQIKELNFNLCNACKHENFICGSTKCPCMPYKKIIPTKIISCIANTHNPLHILPEKHHQPIFLHHILPPGDTHNALHPKYPQKKKKRKKNTTKKTEHRKKRTKINQRQFYFMIVQWTPTDGNITNRFKSNQCSQYLWMLLQ